MVRQHTVACACYVVVSSQESSICIVYPIVNIVSVYRVEIPTRRR